MKNSIFSPTNFFDLSSFNYRKIFDDVENVWEAIPKIAGFIKLKTKKRKNILISRGTIVEKTAIIKGPAIIGKNCHIGPGSFIRENCIIGDGVHIGHAVEIKNSIVLNRAVIAHLNYVGDSIVGSDVNFSGGAIAANYRFDGSEIKVKIREKLIRTQLIKFGSIIGNGSKIGVNAVLNPGTILGKNTIVYPLTSVTGVHRDNEKIK